MEDFVERDLFRREGAIKRIAVYPKSETEIELEIVDMFQTPNIFRIELTKEEFLGFVEEVKKLI